MSDIQQFLIGAGLGILVATLAWWAKALTASGVLAAAITGGLIFGAGGLPWAALLLAFFISSSGLSFAFPVRKSALGEKFAKGSQRDWGQVLANGGLGAMLALIHFLAPGSDWPWVAYAGSLAAVNADTWATEMGVLSRRPPRSLLSWKVVEPGASGGVTLLGALASLLGAVLIGLFAALLQPGGRMPTFVLLIATAGLVASMVDSLLGATVQGIYYCPDCQKETERYPFHSCGTPTSPLRGWRRLNNDLVNLAAACTGAAVAVVLWTLT